MRERERESRRAPRIRLSLEQGDEVEDNFIERTPVALATAVGLFSLAAHFPCGVYPKREGVKKRRPDALPGNSIDRQMDLSPGNALCGRGIAHSCQIRYISGVI